MIVTKFGGTSVQDAAAINQAAKIVASRSERAPIVVVSAMSRVTDALIRMAVAARDRKLGEAISDLEALRLRHISTARELLEEACVTVDGRRLLDSVELEIENQHRELENLIRSVSTLGELTLRTHDAIVSFGERLSSVIITAVFQQRGLPAQLIDSRSFIITDD